VFVDAGVPPWYIHAVGTNQHVGRDGILDAAEDLFREKGYTSVTLADVARAVGIRKPSLYYHFPDGKEQLFVAVQERMFRRMGDQLAEAIDAAEPDLRQQLSDAAEWFFSRPPLFLLMMIHHDMPALADHNRRSLTEASYGVIMQPLVHAAQAAIDRGEIRPINPHTVAGGFLSLLEGNTIAARAGFGHDLRLMMDASLDMIIGGLRRDQRPG
jgi:AcrR family transcriptional regulator